jgi:hypothetical protein
MPMPPHEPEPTRASPIPVWSVEDIRALGATTDLLTAASVLRIGRTKAYQLARTKTFPVPVIRTGRRYLVGVTPLLCLLGQDTKVGASPLRISERP